MLLVYTPKITNRLGYTLGVVLRTVLKLDFSITTDLALFEGHTGAKMAYGHAVVHGVPFFKAHKLLFETTIVDQEPACFTHGGTPVLFPVYGRETDLPFDPFAASFYMLARYEEYLPHREDMHGRFMAADSLAVAGGFACTASVDRWALMVAEVIKRYYPDFELPERKFNAEITVDIDSAYCYLHKGVFRTVTGFMRDGLHRRDLPEVRRRWRVLCHREADPFDTFDYIIGVCREHPDLKLVFFALMGDYGMFDKPISHHNVYFRQLLQHLADYAKVGVHPSYESREKPALVAKEALRLSEVLHRDTKRSRYHFLRLLLPDSYRALANAGIVHDYSMGFADTVGLRAGTGTPYPFYDLESDCETQLTIHPFCLMDTTLQKYMALPPDKAYEHIKSMIDELREVGGTFSCIIHNQNLCELFGWQGWRKVFEQTCDYLDIKS
ncbi:MAG: polysaccharide deacetylase family protein [Bacteroidales bacterium]|nr:polysaccharide deacetylase family protein [Bacteroidales bacterium]